ncbi:ABC transporter permease [Desulfuromonas thiophila]|uniref:ABC transporter permease n=1 Tax=Desulfuromonas thiophila TaxID=57664 RepID=UPI0024A9BA58|nr:ABC transporter permease [Desulfuromonas thiophila]
MLWNALILALREIRRNLLRSFLTMLGIVIGVAAVIVMVTLGSGATAQVTEQIASLGSNLLMARPGQRMGPGTSSSAPPFKLADALAIAREIPAIAAVAPSLGRASIAVFGNKNWSTQVQGSLNSFFQVRNHSLASGRLFSDSEQRFGKAVCVLGETVRRELFGSQNPVGSTIRLGSIACEVVGLLAAKGQSSMGSDQDDLVVLPLRTLQRRLAGTSDISLIQVSVRDGIATETVKSRLEELLRQRRHIGPAESDDFQVMDMKEITTMLTGTTRILTSLLGAVAAVSLLVGGIGIMNIMLVSVTERTREIGIRLAIGAFEREVLLQFLVEAVVLSSLGGLLGIVLALLASLSLAALLQIPFIFNGGIMLLAFAFSAAVGVLFGFMPARKAARLDPIDALRHE